MTSDRDHGEGNSRCTLEINGRGKGLFSGELSTQVPKDGIVKRSGYCNIRTVRHKVSYHFVKTNFTLLNKFLQHVLKLDLWTLKLDISFSYDD